MSQSYHSWDSPISAFPAYSTATAQQRDNVTNVSTVWQFRNCGGIELRSMANPMPASEARNLGGSDDQPQGEQGEKLGDLVIWG